jgi:PAS domain S-box-containing protein
MNALLSALERRTLLSKLLWGFASLLLLSVVIGFFSLRTQLALSEQLQQTYEADLLGVSNAKDVQIDYLRMGQALRQAVVAPDVERRELALAQAAEAEAHLRKELEELRPRTFRSDGKAALARFDDEFERYKRQADKVVVLIREGRFNEAMVRINSDEFQSSGAAAASAVALLVRSKEEGARQGTEAANRLAHDNTRFTILLILGGVVFGVLMAWLIVQSIRRPTERVRTAVETLARGELNIEVPHGDYSNEIGGLARAVQVLQTGARQIEGQSWLKSNLALLSNALQTATTFAELSQTLFSTIAPLLKVGHGALFVHEEDQRRLRLLGGYAYRRRKSLDQYFALGQGLVGQCAMERAPIYLSEPPPDYVRIGSSLGEATPRSIVVLPLLRNERLLGVLELATFDDFGAREEALLDALLPILAMNLEILERSVQARKLLEETQEQARAMQLQAATLEEQAVELEAQQDALKDTEAWYRSIIESAPDGMLVCNERGIITLANPTLEAMFGYGEGELPGHAIEVLVPEAVRGAHVGLREGYASSGGVRAMGSLTRELRGVRRDGSSFAVEVGLSKLPAVGGRGSNVCASVRDITERRAAEDRMAALEERSRLILGSVNDGIVGLDAEGQLSFVNPAVTALLGYSEAELLGQNMHVLMHHTYPDGRHFPRAECSMYLTSVDGVARTVDNEVLWRKDGTALPVEYSTTPVYKDGALVGTVVVFRDITERRAAEEKLRMANFLSDQALDLTHAGHWHIPLNTGDEFYNSSARAAAIFGDPPQPDWRYHLMNHWFANVEAGDKEAATRTFENFNAALAGTVPRYDAVYAYKRPVDGQVVWVHAMGQVVRDASGTPTDMYGVTVDVTAAKLAEAQLVERMEELERFNRLTIDREERMIELKGEVNSLLAEDGLAPKYRIVE